MIDIIAAKLNLKAEVSSWKEYRVCLGDLVQHPLIHALGDFGHHLPFSRLDHSLHVSYLAYLVCKRMGLDFQSAARGGILHDFYFYDSRVTKPLRGIHCFCHPAIALENAQRHFKLNHIERDIIAKHMWPVTIIPPKFRESYVVTVLDKYCASREVAVLGSRGRHNCQEIYRM
ncbi:MAG: HD family phosphohydrolase [Syntrophomonadaceae bacterium]